MSTTHTITLASTREQFECREGETVLKAMSRLGRKGIPEGCYSGGCGVCEIRITAGQCRRGKMSREHITVEAEQAGAALACRVFPESDLTIEVTGKLHRNIHRGAPTFAELLLARSSSR
ncbi:MAG: 2Fe-2S iron-sulfur cluster-binding protein [Gammaproteobacteria bacterium]|nr:2Fe-2S iron-sulfur cluster-binding protein [Gammaproteobacteria bacterium]